MEEEVFGITNGDMGDDSLSIVSTIPNSIIGTIGLGLSSPVFDADHPFPTYEDLIDAGFSEATANNIMDDSRIHSYTDEELYAVLHSDNPAQAYHDMMDEKVHDAINRADTIIDQIENSGLLGSVGATNIDAAGEDSTYLGSSLTETRDRNASSLESELGYKYIHITGSYGFDSDHGGFDRATGQKIHDAIEKARGEERISDYTYRQLIEKLDKACYYQ